MLMEIVSKVLWGLLLLAVGGWLSSMVIVVRQQTAAVVEFLGRFSSVKEAGLRFVPPWPFGRVAERVDLRLAEVPAKVQIKTSDNVFVTFPVTAMVRIDPAKVKDAFYKLENPYGQISAYIVNTIRRATASMTLEQLFTSKDEIAQAVENELKETMAGFGYIIETVLVEQPTPPKEVEDAFNRVISAQRLQDAARMEGEAEKIKRVAFAEAAAEAKRLQGEGIAQQRLAIAKGFKEAVSEMKGAMPEADEGAILATLIIANQFDTIREASQNQGSVILMPYAGEGALSNLAQMAASFRAFPEVLSGKEGGKGAPSALPAA